MYSTGNAFARKDLAAFMKATFAEDYDKERARIVEYAEVKAPEGMLAAAEMGFGVGAVPQMGGVAQSPSAVTSVPTMMPISSQPGNASTNIGTSPGLPPMVRPMPPTLAPAASTPPVVRSPSLTSMPRLTAVAPMLTNGKEEHESTMMADGMGGSPFDEPATNPGNSQPRNLNIRNRAPEPPPVSDVATDPGRPAMPGPPVMQPAEPRRVTRNMPPAPPPPMISSDTSPTLSAVNYQSQVSLQHVPPPPPAGVSAGNTKLIIALAANVALLVGVVGVVLLKPSATGLLMVNVPDAVSTTATLNINGKAVTDETGNPIKEWPQIRSLPVGKVTVMLKAPGYETLVETVEVREGNEPVQLKGELKKKP